jgi:acetate kinase
MKHTPRAAEDGIVVVNAGSSSIKFAVFTARGPQVLEASARGEIEGIATVPHFFARDSAGASIGDKRWDGAQRPDLHGLLGFLLEWIEAHLGAGRLRAAGHRVATGGLAHSQPVRVDATVLERLHALVPLAPLHQPRNLEPMQALARLHPTLPQVACFDTAFHRTLPEVATLYGLPRHLIDAGARRYGYHGLSYEFIAGELPRVDPHAAAGRTIVAHLGSGASLCALEGGRSVATTMGFSPLSGLVMGTRPGELDAGLLLWMLRRQDLDIDRLEAMLYRESGLAGVSGLGGDMRALLASDDARARSAVDLFVHRLCAEVGALSAALQGLDALVFTAGIGENAAVIRARVCRQLAWLGVTCDEAANARGGPRISKDGGAVAVWVIPTNEELAIARHVAGLVAADEAPISNASRRTPS